MLPPRPAHTPGRPCDHEASARLPATPPGWHKMGGGGLLFATMMDCSSSWRRCDAGQLKLGSPFNELPVFAQSFVFAWCANALRNLDTVQCKCVCEQSALDCAKKTPPDTRVTIVAVGGLDWDGGSLLSRLGSRPASKRS
jgi:hypothetical protein